MSTRKNLVTPIGPALTVAAALGSSLGTLLGATGTRKLIQDFSVEGDEEDITSSNPTTLLRAMSIEHPVGTLVLEALEGMEVAFGTGVTSLVTLCGTLSTACRRLQEQGLMTSAIRNGLYAAEDICVHVLQRLAFRIEDVPQFDGGGGDIRFCDRVSGSTIASACRFGSCPPRKGTATELSTLIPVVEALAAGFQQSADRDYMMPMAERNSGKASGQTMSLPASLAVQALTALLEPDSKYVADANGESMKVPDITQLDMRLIVGRDASESFIVRRGAAVEIAPWQRAAVQDTFVARNSLSDTRPEDRRWFDSSPLATTVIRIAAVVVVLGDISLTAGASHAAMSQTPLTEVLRNGEALLNRSAGGERDEQRYADDMLDLIEENGVQAVVSTGGVCAPLRQGLASRKVLLLAGVSLQEAEAVGLTSGATPVPTLGVLTVGDVGRGCPAGNVREAAQGVAATLLEIGRATYDQAMYRPEETNRERLGLQQPHVLLLLHPREHAFRGWHGEPSEDGVCDGRKQTEDRRNRRTNVIVVLCGPIASACEELRHRFWRMVRRVIGALSDGSVLPGAGACDIACGASLELEALRLDSENIEILEEDAPGRLYTPTVLRSVASAFDDTLLTRWANTGHCDSAALHLLSTAKKHATWHLQSQQRQSSTKGDPSTRSPSVLDSPRFGWSFDPDAAMASTSDPNTRTCAHRDDARMAGQDFGSSCEGKPFMWCCEQGARIDKGSAPVFDNFRADIGRVERAVGLVVLLAEIDGIVLPPSTVGGM